MATFYPINTPLINYFFYKAPFINDAYSLTNLTVLAGGSGYVINDIVILGGGTYTNPAVIKVTGVTSGAITSFDITSNGKYSVSPTTLTQLSTNGIGTGATFNGLVFTPNLYPIGPNVPLSGGFIYFYEDENRTVQANTYSDVFDSSNPVINPNPIQLGTSGDFPPIYMEDRLYYIVITDNTGDQANPVEVLEHYNPSEVVNQPSAFNDNFVVNPQFNYPIVFHKTTDELGEITQPLTRVAWGWEFIQDDATESKTYITFENISGSGIEGNPINQIVIDADEVTSEDTVKDLRSYLGAVDFYNGNTLTFCAQMISLSATAVPVEIYLELNYGHGGDFPELVLLNTFSVGTTRKKYSYSFTVPSISGKIIGNGNFLAFHIRSPLNAISKFGVTNVMVAPGTQPSIIFNDESYGYSKALIIGEATQIAEAGLEQNYSSYYYTDGEIFPHADTGAIVLVPNVATQEFREKCDGTTRAISDYSVNDIPYSRLYSVIGDAFGSSGTIIASANEATVTASLSIGGRQKTVWENGDTAFTFTNTVIGLALGIRASIDPLNPLKVDGEFIDQFAPDQGAPVYYEPNGINPFGTGTGNGLLTYWGASEGEIPSTNLTITTIDPGSGITNAEFSITFNVTDPMEYRTRQVAINTDEGVYYPTSSFLEFSSFDDNSRRPAGQNSNNQQVLFFVDGPSPNGPRLFDYYDITYVNRVSVNFKSTVSIQKNVKTFVDTINNPFTWTILVNTVPAAGKYFLYSDSLVDYYGWFTVDGVGVDPAIGLRTGVEIPLFTGYDTKETATAIALAISTARFGLPAPADLPALVVDSKVSWFINL